MLANPWDCQQAIQQATRVFPFSAWLFKAKQSQNWRNYWGQGVGLLAVVYLLNLLMFASGFYLQNSKLCVYTPIRPHVCPYSLPRHWHALTCLLHPFASSWHFAAWKKKHFDFAEDVAEISEVLEGKTLCWWILKACYGLMFSLSCINSSACGEAESFVQSLRRLRAFWSNAHSTGPFQGRQRVALRTEVGRKSDRSRTEVLESDTPHIWDLRFWRCRIS